MQLKKSSVLSPFHIWAPDKLDKTASYLFFGFKVSSRYTQLGNLSTRSKNLHLIPTPCFNLKTFVPWLIQGTHLMSLWEHSGLCTECAVSWPPKNMTPRCRALQGGWLYGVHAHKGVWLGVVLSTEESDYGLFFPLKSLPPWFPAHRGVFYGLSWPLMSLLKRFLTRPRSLSPRCPSHWGVCHCSGLPTV